TARLTRHRHRRRDRRDSADTRRDFRDAERLSAREVQAIDVRESVLISDEEQVLAIRRKLRVDVLAAREWRKDADTSGRHVVRRELERRVRELVEISLRAAVGREGDGLSVGGPRRLNVRVLVVRQLANGARLEIEQIEI